MTDERPAEIKLTQEQLDRLPIAEPGPPWAAGAIGAFLGTPIRIVDDYWESTPGQKHFADLIEVFDPHRQAAVVDESALPAAFRPDPSGITGPAATITPDMIGFLRNVLDPQPQPESPRTHTFNPPPDEYDDDGNEIFKPLQPSLSIEHIEPERPMWLGGRRPGGDKRT